MRLSAFVIPDELVGVRISRLSITVTMSVRRNVASAAEVAVAVWYVLRFEVPMMIPPWNYEVNTRRVVPSVGSKMFFTQKMSDTLYFVVILRKQALRAATN